MRIICIFLIIILLSSCHNLNNRQTELRKVLPLKYNIYDFKGIWVKNINENAVFEISNDTMFLLEGGAVKFEVKQDSLITYYKGLTTRDKIIKLNSDSLVLLNQLGEYIYLIRKKH